MLYKPLVKKIAIGRLKRIRRYPVKSLGGNDLDTIYVNESGLNGDRLYAFHDHNTERLGLPYLTIREKNDLLLLKPQINDDQFINTSYPTDYRPDVQITINGINFQIENPDLIRHLKNSLDPRHQNISLEYQKTGIFDTHPISFVSLQSIHKLAKEAGKESVNPLRFRSNFYVDWNNNEAFFEEKLIDQSIQIGDQVILKIVQQNVRCTIINVDPQTADKDSTILKTVSNFHNTRFGIYAKTISSGIVKTGDTIYLLE